MIIGAARTGTSSLHRNLQTHPQLLGPNLGKIGVAGWDKEAHFFDKDGKFNKGISWYLRLWPDIEGPLKFESTPHYLYDIRVPGRIKKTLPNWNKLKFIVMLRDPVLRAWSHFWHWRNRHRMPVNALFTPNADWIKKGLYLEQLQNWHKHFRKEQFLIIKSEDFYANSQAVILEVHKWLGIEQVYVEKPVYFDPKRGNQNKKNNYPSIPKSGRRQLSEFYRSHNKELFKYLGKEFKDWL